MYHIIWPNVNEQKYLVKCYINDRISEDDIFIMLVFNAKLIKEDIKYDKEEMLNVKWVDYD